MREFRVQNSFLWLASVLALVLLVACGERGQDDPPGPGAERESRIVVMSPGIAESIREIGLGDRIVGRHAFDEFTDPTIPAVGDQAGIDYEALLRTSPTIVLLERSASGVPPRLLELAAARDFEVRELGMLSLDEIRRSIEALPDALGAPESRAGAQDLLDRLDVALSPSEEFGARAGRMLALYWTRPVGAAGPGSYHAEIITSLGGLLALDDGAPYRQLDPEDVRRIDPDSIALFMPGADPTRLDEALGPLRSLDLRAVREGRVVLVEHPQCQTPGPSAIHVADSLRERVLGWPPLAPN